ISFIKYDVAVREGKEIIANEKRGQMRLGELADKLEPKYADRTLAKFAAEIGIAACTLERHRSVYRAWKENPAPGPGSYSVLRALQDHPDRRDIVKNNPDLTQAEARNQSRNQRHASRPRAPPYPRTSPLRVWTLDVWSVSSRRTMSRQIEAE